MPTASTGGAATARSACPVTRPGPTHSTRPNDFSAAAFNYGTRLLRVQLWPKGTLVAGVLPDGGAWATVNADGSIAAKLGWWRGASGKLVIRGRRLDAPAPTLRTHIPVGYGARGFQPSGLTFPTPGCWRITGAVGRGRLTFVVRVVKRPTR